MTFTPKAIEAAARALALADLDEQTRDVVDLDKHMSFVRNHYEGLAEAALTAALAVDGVALQGWQPIESAPKDGTWILGWSDPDKSPYRIVWGRNHRNELTWCTNFSSFIEGYITHWMPLPPPPAASDGEERPSPPQQRKP